MLLPLKICHGQTAKQRDSITLAQASAFFDEGRYFQAAQAYSQCSATFEEVILKFLDAGERDALRSYLISRLERTKRTVQLFRLFENSLSLNQTSRHRTYLNV